MERMVCMLPAKSFAGQNDDKLFLSLTERDQYNSQLWDIEPLCQVAGVGEDKELILDACRAISIRWKAFPQIEHKRSAGFRKLLAELAALGLGLIARYAYRWSNNQTLVDAPPPDADVAQIANDVFEDQSLVVFGAFCLLGSFLLALAAPASVRRLYGGRVMQSAPWLVGFEGVMPIDSLEKTIFGNDDDDRLTYEPSSTVFAEREGVQCVDLAKHPNVAHPRFSERIWKELAWVRCPGAAGDPRVSRLPKGHRLFTLVDTGALTVSIFSAVRPPSVALLCGREGGMLRTVLCHYERSNNCLYKETVARTDSMTLNQAKVLSWVKLSLGNVCARCAASDLRHGVSWGRCASG
ncbi:hypothetical protein BJ546DRAFT_1064284 [Cryomyces antarcticus]|nr:hypothetical protein LTR04_000949 [Oleoguttula sp. CCFEE 6159]